MRLDIVTDARNHVEFGAPRMPPRLRPEALEAAAAEIADLLRRNSESREAEQERAAMLDRIEARRQASSERLEATSQRTVYEANRRVRDHREAMRQRAALLAVPASVPMVVPQPVPEPVAARPERSGGWWDDPVAAEAIDLVDTAPLGTEAEVKRVRISVSRMLHPDKPGNEEYGPLLTSINELLDGALERIRAGVPDEVPVA